MTVFPMLYSKQMSLWMEGDMYRKKQREQENGNKVSMTFILSGVDDISLQDDLSKASGKEDIELVILCKYIWAQTSLESSL